MQRKLLNCLLISFYPSITRNKDLFWVSDPNLDISMVLGENLNTLIFNEVLLGINAQNKDRDEVNFEGDS